VDGSGPTVRRVRDAGDLELFARVDAAAFGVRPDPAVEAAKLPVREPDRFLIAECDGEPVGVAGSLAFDLTLPGGATVPVAGITDVGVLPTHRRRGVLRALVRALHDDAAGRGEAAAVLSASEALIYPRFGYGVATRTRFVRLDLRRSAFRDDAPRAGGRLRLVERAEAAPTLAEVYRRAAPARPGTLSRSAAWWGLVLGDAESWPGGGVDWRVVVHEDGAGRPDAYGIHRMVQRWTPAGPDGTVEVREVVATDAAAELAVWRWLFDLDLVRTAELALPPDHPLDLVLADGRATQPVGERDFLWLRALDVDRLLSTRRYDGDGAVVLEVHGAGGGPGRVHRLEVSGGAGACHTVRERPELSCGIAELAVLFLGDRRVRALVEAGRVRELRPGAAARADALFATPVGPWCGTRF
jgi:predicted acetyltransferase